MTNRFGSKLTLVGLIISLAGGTYVLAQQQIGVPRVPQAQVPQVPLPIFSRPAVPPRTPGPDPIQLPVISGELAKAFAEAAARHLDYLPGRVLVKFKPGMGVSGQARALGVLGSDRPLSNMEFVGDLAVVKDSTGADPHDLAARLRQQPEVEYAEPDYLMRKTGTPNDPDYGARQWNFSMLNMPAAWDVNAGGSSNVIVAMVDTGITSIPAQNVTVQTWSGSAIVNYTMPVGPSPDFTLTRFVFPRDFTISSTSPPSIVIDTDGHGSHTSGTVGENTNNGAFLAGIAYNVRLMPLKACLSYWDVQFAWSAAGFTGFVPIGSGGCPTSATSAAIRFAADNGARVINYSIGGTSPNTTVQGAMQYAFSKGVFIAISNGNSFEEGNPTTYPASYAIDMDGAMSVASITRVSTKAYYSSTGSWTEIAAPGGDSHDGNYVWQTTLLPSDSSETTVTFPRFDRYAEVPYQGTSMAAPHVAGLAALIISQNPSITPARIEQIIRSSAKDLGTSGRDNVFGYGLIQPRAALFGQGIR